MPRPGMMLPLMMIWLALATGCVTHTVREIPSDRSVVTLKAGVPFTPAVPGKFVPEATFIELMDVYVRESLK
jgi:hypothetical protein